MRQRGGNAVMVSCDPMFVHVSGSVISNRRVSPRLHARTGNQPGLRIDQYTTTRTHRAA